MSIHLRQEFILACEWMPTNFNMLQHLKWRFQGNFDTDLFSHQAIYNQKENQIEMYLHCQKSHVVHLECLDLSD